MNKVGLFKYFRAALKRRRVGELLVTKGLITPQDLRNALRTHQETRAPLGQVFVEQAAISKTQLRLILLKQTALHTCTALLLCAASLSGGAKKSRADMIKDVPAQIRLVSASSEFKRVASYPAFYGTQEKRSSNLSAFTKWTSMFDRFDRQLKQSASSRIVHEWQENLRGIEGQSLKAMADRVNDLVNEKRYIVDSKNWGQSDYWATPVEFLQRGGDCEDFAIMKYVALRSLGVPEDRMRIAIVQDTQKNIPHAVLVVYTEQGAYLLDNQNKHLISAERGSRYRPIYSINRQAWWLHSAPSKTIIASAE
ncbi:MAG TPA: transglutaminase-like cysteine peptidase [Alphaproteobacteria bacterium]|nr:transglutaminase-like cysteine peptidase [Alphaproteobacteria bacterium]USO05076.1 MAG: transglutaminase-like cysteine peptidase [Rhodospirillales bacterium]HOO82242.1 transglutaminase-like cysteine peptidase [Alphaproteobacteria bacterium]